MTLMPIFVCNPEDCIIELIGSIAFLYPDTLYSVGGLLHCRKKIYRMNIFFLKILAINETLFDLTIITIV